MAESSAAARHRARNFYGRTPPPLPTCKTDLDVLVERHRFIRDSDEQDLSWEDALAKKTYDQLFKELAVCDLSRWKEAKVAMRWRTAGEVIDGRGHFTCANLRCKRHQSAQPRSPCPRPKSAPPSKATPGFEDQCSFIPLDDASESAEPAPDQALQELQTQFGYIEQGVRKMAEVKLRLCKRCARKMDACSQSKRRVELPGSSSTKPSPTKLSRDRPRESVACDEQHTSSREAKRSKR